MKHTKILTQAELNERIRIVSREIRELKKPRDRLSSKICYRRKRLKELKILCKGQVEIKVKPVKK